MPWIRLEEYELGLPDRAQVNELQPEIRYTLMTKLRPNKYGQEAVKDAVELLKVERTDELAIVRFVMPFTPPALDKYYSGTVKDGFWQEVYQQYDIGDITTKEAYFSFDTTGFDDGLERLSAELLMPVGNVQVSIPSASQYL